MEKPARPAYRSAPPPRHPHPLAPGWKQTLVEFFPYFAQQPDQVCFVVAEILRAQLSRVSGDHVELEVFDGENRAFRLRIDPLKSNIMGADLPCKAICYGYPHVDPFGKDPWFDAVQYGVQLMDKKFDLPTHALIVRKLGSHGMKWL